MRRFALALALAVVATLAAPTPSPAGAACADIQVPLRNLKVVAKWAKPSVRVGQTAFLKTNITRTADHDPVSEDGIPYPTGRPMDEPVEGAEVGVGLWVGDYYLSGGGVTDAQGNVKIPVRIESYVEPGPVRVGLFATYELTPPDFPSAACRVVVYEWGVLDPGPKVKVSR